MGTVYFDLETTGLGDDAEITCGVILDSNGNSKWYHSGYGKTMSPNIGQKLLDALEAAETVVSFNGAQFDFRKLFDLTQDDRAKVLARTHVDVLVLFAAQKGYFSSLASFAEGTFPGTCSKSNTGEWAAQAWETDGKSVLEYCEQDTVVLKNVYEYLQSRGGLKRVTNSGKVTSWVAGIRPDSAKKSVDTCLSEYRETPPDVSWMTDPPDISNVLSWV